MKPSKTGHSTESHQEAMARRKATLAAISASMGNPVIPPPTQEQRGAGFSTTSSSHPYADGCCRLFGIKCAQNVSEQ
jgi:hypothetical protein